jgi:hypothetical protein
MGKDGKENNIAEKPLTEFDGSLLTINHNVPDEVKVCFRAFSDINACVHYTSSRIGGIKKFFGKVVLPVPQNLNLNGLRFELKDMDTKEYLLKGIISYGTK